VGRGSGHGLTRMQAWLAGFTGLLLCLFVAACGHVSGGVGAGFDPAGLPVEFSVTFTVGPDGSIAIGGSVGIVTEVGVFSLQAHIETSVQPSQDETLLVIRHHVKGGIADTVYRIGDGTEAVVQLNGSTTLYVTNHKILIDATRASETVTVMNAPVPSPSSQVASAPPGTLRLLRSIQSSAVTMSTLAWSPDSSEIADAGTTGDSLTSTVAEVRRVSNGGLVTVHRGMVHYVSDISWSPDGRRIATPDQGCYCVQVWDAGTGHTMAIINNNEPPVRNVSWSPDSRYLVIASDGDHPSVWNAATGAQVNTYNGDQAFSRYPAVWAPSGDMVVDGGEIWNALSDQTVQTFGSLDQYGPFGAESWSPDGKRIVSASLADVIVWDASSGTIIWTQQLSAGLLSWAPGGKYIAWTNSGLGGIVDAASGSSVATFQNPDGSDFDTLAWSPDGRYIATTSNGEIQIWAAPG
jgi:WD40 repeat protein